MAFRYYSEMKTTIGNIGEDVRCDVHQTVLGIREGKEGWFHLYCPGGIACDDDGNLFGRLVSDTQLFFMFAKKFREQQCNKLL